MDAAAIRDGLREHGDDHDLPSVPAFYRMLRKAVDAGWLTIEGAESPSEGRGRPRQRYRISQQGRSAVEERAETLERFARLALGHEGGSR